MSLLKSNRLLMLILPVLFAVVVLLMVLLVSDTKTAHAQSPECNVVVALDKSPSIGAENLETLKDNVMRLLDNLSGADVLINLGFWTFSHSDSDSSDYNQPRHDYISTRTSDPVVLQEFEDSLPTAGELEGQTDYAQAYGYSAGEVDPANVGSINDINLTPNNSINSIRSRADVVVLLTDGAPNYPGGSDNNEAARYAGRSARLKYPENVSMVGGYITDIPNFNPVSLKYVINGSDTDDTRVGPVSFDGNGSNDQIYTYVRDRVLEVCGGDLTDYWLKPKANVDTSAVQEGNVVNFSYQVDKDRDEAASRSSDWQIYDVTIAPEVTGNPLDFQIPGSACTNNSGEPYCDNVTNCNVIMGKIANKGTCSEIPQADRGRGNSSFSGGQNLFYSPDRSVTIGSYPLGTRVCSLLVIRVASMSGNVNRASSVACATVGKTPLVQVHGGDIRVGRYFASDTSPRDQDPQAAKAGVYTSRFKINQNSATVPNGRTYGSWVEYGVLAPGPIEKIASLSGFAGENGGYDTAIAGSICDTNINKLTFANLVDDSQDCGHYKGDIGAIPDVVSALTSGQVISATSYTLPLGISGSSPNSSNGRYENTTDNANFEITDSTLERGKTYIVYVPRGTVTIAGNITYGNPNDRYTDIRDIPQLVIIARDISIRESVTQINAWLVAAGEGEEGGKLDTCTGFTPPFSSEVCNQRLTINGPVMARDLHLWRTTVQKDSCTIEAIEDCNDTGNPGEIMNLAGSSILWTQGYNENSARARTTSTVELPPYF